MKRLFKIFAWDTHASEIQKELNKQHARSFGWLVLSGHEEKGEPRGTRPYIEEQSLIKRWAVKYN